MEDPVRAEIVEPAGEEDQPRVPDVTEPNKLIRIASMTRAMLEEARTAPLDDGGRKRMAEVHARSVEELKDVLSPDLQNEFSEIMIPLSDSDASEAELRVAQAQLIGWLEGVFHGIQASLWSQQMTAQAQLAEMQRRALGNPGPEERDNSSGLYL